MKIPFINRITGIFGVEDSVLHGQFSEIVICNATKEICLRCDHNTDELLLSSGSKKKRHKLVRILSGSFRVEWIWTMTNQQGYCDGFRIQLGVKQQSHVFEFISIGSCIDIYKALKSPNKTVHRTIHSAALSAESKLD